MPNRNLIILEEQKKLEKELISKLYQESNAASFKDAYDQIHSFFLKNPHPRTGKRRDKLYEKINYIGKLFLKIIGNDNKIIEIGCGNGFLSKKLSEENNSVVSIDISEIALDISKRNKTISLDLEYCCNDARNLAFKDQSFDVAISIDMIEHLPPEDINNHFSEVRRVLKNNGCYLFYTPHILYGPTSLGLHFKEYTLAEMCEILEKHRFDSYIIIPHFILFGLKVKLGINKAKFYERIIMNYKIYKIFKSKLIATLFVPPICILAYKN